MAKFFVSHTGLDADWASWIGFQTEGLGHEAFVDRWEISGGDDVAAWMDARLDAADHCVCVCSSTYFGETYSDWERRSALSVRITKRSNFVLPIIVAPCELPVLMSSLSHCNLFEAGANEAAARRLLHAFLTPSGKPASSPRFPGAPLSTQLFQIKNLSRYRMCRSPCRGISWVATTRLKRSRTSSVAERIVSPLQRCMGYAGSEQSHARGCLCRTREARLSCDLVDQGASAETMRADLVALGCAARLGRCRR